jgi:hypothetical protein
MYDESTTARDRSISSAPFSLASSTSCSARQTLVLTAP